MQALRAGAERPLACDKLDAANRPKSGLPVPGAAMIREHADVAILGAGFAGSVMALVLQRIGRRALLIERGVHPRFAIGDSSTPLANLALEELGRKYDLPELFALSEFGRWQKAHPELPCGLKRGFSYFRHDAGRPFQPHPDHSTELLVAANPSDDAAET